MEKEDINRATPHDCIPRIWCRSYRGKLRGHHPKVCQAVSTIRRLYFICKSSDKRVYMLTRLLNRSIYTVKKPGNQLVPLSLAHMSSDPIAKRMKSTKVSYEPSNWVSEANSARPSVPTLGLSIVMVSY